VLSSLGLTLVRRRGYVVPWLAVLAGTWALVWLVEERPRLHFLNLVDAMKVEDLASLKMLH